MTVVIIFRVLLLIAVRTKLYEAFYRPKPARANIITLALEAANFALSFGFIIVRSVKLLFISAFYIGRIDTPFLAPGVGNPWGYFELDNYPTIFTKDILAHEAHRHPFIEMLGTVYMLKLRHGDYFGSRAGSCWRLIFVFALMPWLSKYRLMTRANMRDEGMTIESERSSINFVSLRNLVPPDNEIQCRPDSRENAGKEAQDQSPVPANDSSVLDRNEGAPDEVDVETDGPSFSSAHEKAIWLEHKNAVLELEVKELKRKLLLLEMKVHRRSSLPQLKT
uniref:Uncharacterized protein n=2 Tax=Odontella aurita TaxID=265563 RepID=A0A6U6KSK7_9STRA|mmetsp:Transcript_62343/g.184479  ORF Transcript_62343/g.184479 Transcript_62343/m.184479 type:complete len:279 (+) Transcript_62343:2546-3382(+)